MKLKIDVFPFIVKNTAVSIGRLESIYKFCRKVSTLSGNIAEVGVWKGGSSYLLALANPSKIVHIFDTFEGHPDQISEFDTPPCHEAIQMKGGFGEPHLQEYVTGLLSGFTNVSIHKGIFPKDSSDIIKNERFSLVHVDVDIYQSVLDCVKFFYPRMVRSGIILFDDYLQWDCPGAKKALDEFMVGKPEPILMGSEVQAYIVKE